MRLRIDHVTVAAPRLGTLQQAFAEVGLVTDYGGPHSNNITHMSLLGFDDGSYIELISMIEAGKHSPWWHEHIVHDGGTCAWAIEAEDVAAEAHRLQGLGVTVDGPHHLYRKRPDGKQVEWDLAFVGDHGPGALLPFIIKDRTPRHYRVAPSASVYASELSGVAVVVLGVDDIARAANLFRHVYGLPPPVYHESPDFEATLASFAGQPFALAAPLASRNWLQARLDRFGPSPCAVLIGTRDMALSLERLPLRPATEWNGKPLAWLQPPMLNRLCLGIISP